MIVSAPLPRSSGALDLYPDAARICDDVRLLDPDADGLDAHIIEAFTRNELGQGLDEVDVPLRDDALDLAHDDFVAHDVLDVLAERVAGLSHREIEIDDDPLRVDLLFRVDAEQSLKLEISHEDMPEPSGPACDMAADFRFGHELTR